MKPQPEQVAIYTDGACLGNPGPGGWAALLRYKSVDKWLSGGEPATTNNRMELMAAIAALEALRRPCRVELTTDSQYLKRGVTEWLDRWIDNGWRTADRKAVKNQDLWERLHVLRRQHSIKWEWTRGHAGHAENVLVDEKAREAALAIANQRG